MRQGLCPVLNMTEKAKAAEVYHWKLKNKTSNWHATTGEG